jgi:hypothetical protein
MDYMNFLAGGAALGLVTSCWSYIRGFAWKLMSTLIQRVEIPDNDLCRTLMGHLITHYPRSRIYDRVYASAHEYIKTGEQTGEVPYEWFGQRGLILWNGWLPFIVNRGRAATTALGGIEPSLVLTYLRGALNVDRVLAAACRERNTCSWKFQNLTENQKKRFFIRYVPNIKGQSDDEDRSRQHSAGIPWYHHGLYRTVAYRPEELGRGRDPKDSALDLLIFPPRVLELIQEIKLWRNNRKWYQRRGIPWKRGWLLYGPPGTGKTALARAFAEDLDMPIFVFNLSELGNFEFMSSWLAMQACAPCVALIEDIDNVFHGRENVSRQGSRSFLSLMNLGMRKKGPHDEETKKPTEDTATSSLNEQERAFFAEGMLSFDVLLNMLDGVDRNDGVFTIITTNDISKIDAALGQPRRRPDGTLEFISTRPGRIDKAIELGYMAPEDKQRMAERILGEYPEALAEMLDFVATAGFEETPAQFQERCSQIALRRFWEEQNNLARAAKTPRRSERALAHEQAAMT